MVDLQGQMMSWSCTNHPGNVLTPDQWSGRYAMCSTGQHQPWICQPNHE